MSEDSLTPKPRAKKSATKVAAKAATKPASKTKAKPESAPEPVVIAPAPAPVAEAAVAEAEALPAKKAVKRATKKAAPAAEPEPVAPVAAMPAPKPEAPAPDSEFPPAPEMTAAKTKKATKKAATPRGKKAAEAEAPAVAPSLEVQPPPIPEPPPLPEFFPTAEDVEVAPAPPPAAEGAASPPDKDSAREAHRQEMNNPKKMSRRQRWKEKLRQRYLARQTARANGDEIAPEAPPEVAPAPRAAPAGRHQPQPQHQPRGRDDRRRDDRGRDDRDRDRVRDDDADQGSSPESLLGPSTPVEGILELTPKGYGFLRLREKLYAPLNSDCWVSGDLIRKYGLREGMCLSGEQRLGNRGPQMSELKTVNGADPEDVRNLPLFEELKATNPNKRYQLETKSSRMTTRVIDMMTPVGRGQRGLIVAPPRAGKTTLLQHVAEAITENYQQVHLMILLVDERPEEVTEFRRVLPNAEIFASSNDQDVKSHMRIAQFAIERAKRLVEMGHHVFMLMDSITRLARAFNSAQQGGATMSGGMGVGAMEIPRRLFAAARNTKTAGSLTILATALVETGSRMDDLIFQEFKGTGNMELVLDRKIAEQFLFPAVNIFKSGTRREELLLQTFQIEKIHFLRRGLSGHKPIEALQRVLSLLEKYPTNSQMLVELSTKQH